MVRGALVRRRDLLSNDKPVHPCKEVLHHLYREYCDSRSSIFWNQTWGIRPLSCGLRDGNMVYLDLLNKFTFLKWLVHRDLTSLRGHFCSFGTFFHTKDYCESDAISRQISTVNVKGNRHFVYAHYCASNTELVFKIPDGLDLKDPSQVVDYWVKWETLYIKYKSGEFEQF
jgi:hypothetical protein